MPLNFPSNPSVNQQSTQNGRTFLWTGYAWELVASGGGGEDTLLRSLFVSPAPTSVTATEGNAQAVVSWTAPTGVISQAPITDYTVQYSSNSGSTWTTFSDGTSTATSATVTGLTNGTAYVFRVAAVNAVGTGSYSAASSAVTPSAGTPPGAPTGLTATAGNAQISLAWTAPSSVGSSAITGYSVEYTPSGGSAVTVNTGGTATSYTLTGLTNGTAYTARVAAVNAAGTGTYTAASSSVTPSAASVPGAPTNLGFGAGACGQGGFSWTAPASNGGSAITGYRLRGSANNYATFTAASSTSIAGFRDSFAGLGANNTWTVRVSAVNSVGEGPYVAFTMLDDNNAGFASGCG